MRIRKKLSKKELELRINELELENRILKEKELNPSMQEVSDSTTDLLLNYFNLEKTDVLIYDIHENRFSSLITLSKFYIINSLPASLEDLESSFTEELHENLNSVLYKLSDNKTYNLQTKYAHNPGDSKENTPINLDVIPIGPKNEKFIFVIKDFSKEYKKQKELIRSREKIDESDKLKSIILSNISHHIRTPLNSVTGFAELLATTSLNDEKRQEYIDIIKRQSKRILTLIDDLSEIAKLESGNINISKTPCSLNLILRELLLGINKHRAEKRKELVKIESNLPKSGLDILTDSGRLLQALTHILNYSLRYTQKGKIELGYTLDVENQRIEFYVQDTSEGLTKDEQKIIFNKFTAIDNTESTRLDDPGLGLTIAKTIIKALGGRIWVESEVNSGTKFIFTLPYEPFISSEDQKDEQVDDLPQQLQYEWPNKVILVVDDEEVNAMFLDAVFHGTSAQMIFAKNGQEAIELCKSINKIDLILMDLKMPVLNGLKATKEIRKFNTKVPIIAQTALASEEDRQNCEIAGCNDTITKPIEVEQLLEMVNRYISD